MLSKPTMTSQGLNHYRVLPKAEGLSTLFPLDPLLRFGVSQAIV